MVGNWRSKDFLARSMRGAQGIGSIWMKAIDPVAAVVANAERTGWTIVAPSLFKTYPGKIIDLELDSSAAVAAEVRATVRR